MKKNIAVIPLIILILLIGFFTGFAIDDSSQLNEKDSESLGNYQHNRTELTVSSEGPIPLSIILNEIENEEYFEGYDEDTFLWMKTLPQQEVFKTDSSYVIMNKRDASKLNTEYVLDACTVEYIDCIVIENRSLGGKYQKDILIVEDVEYKGNYTYYFDV